MDIKQFLLCLLLSAFNMHTICWIPESNSKDIIPLTEEEKNAMWVRWEERDAQNPVDRKSYLNDIIKRYDQKIKIQSFC